MHIETDIRTRLIQQPKQHHAVRSDRGKLIDGERVPAEVVYGRSGLGGGQDTVGRGGPDDNGAVPVVTCRSGYDIEHMVQGIDIYNIL